MDAVYRAPVVIPAKGIIHILSDQFFYCPGKRRFSQYYYIDFSVDLGELLNRQYDADELPSELEGLIHFDLRGKKHVLLKNATKRTIQFDDGLYNGYLNESLHLFSLKTPQNGHFHQRKGTVPSAFKMRKGLKEGDGIMEYDNGDVYDGEWYNDLKQGYGQMDLSNGTSFVGEWSNDYMVKGIFTYKTGETYEGFFDNGLPHGYGEMMYQDGEKDQYKGFWVDGKPDGQGTMYYSSGDIYNGEWVNGVFQGIGTMYFNNSDFFNGHWFNGLQHGKGTLFYTDGSVEEGIWENGSKIEKHKSENLGL
jgi:hypothetical protein